MKYNNFTAEILLPPINDPHIFTGGEIGDYIFAGGRVNAMKRQHLLLEALSRCDRNVKLIIAGPPDTPEDANRLQAIVEQHGLEARVKLDLRFLPRDTYANYINGSAAVAYLPFDEDSFGYVAMEAATAGKALITTSDSGGILGLVKHELTGWVAEPSTASLATAMSAVWQDRRCTREYGAAAKDHWLGFDINWQKTVETLLR
jgi:glycosyltransferase involved in cell wall biosynthesis